MKTKAKPHAIALTVIVVTGTVMALWYCLPAPPAGRPVSLGPREHDAYERKQSAAADAVVAASGLRHSRDPEAVTYLLQSLKDPNPKVRATVAEALQEIADPRASEGLLTQLEKEYDPSVATAIIRALAAVNLNDPAPPVLKRINDPSAMVRLAVVENIGHCTVSNAVAALASATSDTNNSVRANASECLTRIGEPAIPAMLAFMGEGSNLARIYRIAALSRIKSDKTVPALIQVLRTHDPNVAADRYPAPDTTPVRVAVLDALAEIGEPAAVVIARDEIGKTGDLAFKAFAADLFRRIQSPAGVKAITERLMNWKTVQSEAEWNLWADMLAATDTLQAREALARLKAHGASLAGTDTRQ